MIYFHMAICDDTISESKEVKEHLTRYSIQANAEFSIQTFTDPLELLKNYQNSNQYQVLFLDVELPHMHGIQLAKKIRSTINRNVIIVFISSYPEYMKDSFQVHPFHYLVKPISFPAISSLMDQIMEEIEVNEQYYTIIGNDNREWPVFLKDIYYIEIADSKREMLQFYFADHDICAKGMLSDWTKQLRHLNFMPCFRNSIVNLLHIHYFENHCIYLDNGTRLKMSRNFEKALKERYLNQINQLS